ncbi:hypothetical protein F5148DRAFT_1371662 [Russula earlei]|uniref:Uncharacterized protein n=1 Tax=Russula earlei TaxID=71964 RepID=A0ACC0TTN3_9AGAM|nr:hypothetical protein F5148DRAFT_1371662 [Russula earlei]
MHRARETKTHRAHWSWVEEMGGGGGRRTGQDRDAECVVVARPLTRENARMSRTREAQLCAIRGSCTPHRRWPGPREGFESEMKTKKRTRSWSSRGSHIHGRVVMVTTAGEWVPVGGGERCRNCCIGKERMRERVKK